MISANTYHYINNDAMYFYIENELELPNENGKYWYYNKNGEIVTKSVGYSPKKEILKLLGL